MKKYINIQLEVINDLNINLDDLDINIKNSVQSCYRTFYQVLLHKYKSEIVAKDITNELMKKYELYLI